MDYEIGESFQEEHDSSKEPRLHGRSQDSTVNSIRLPGMPKILGKSQHLEEVK
jgi:hypothetical protein